MVKLLRIIFLVAGLPLYLLARLGGFTAWLLDALILKLDNFLERLEARWS